METNGNSDPSWSPGGDAIALGATVGTAGSSTQHPIQILNLKSHELTALPDSGQILVAALVSRWALDRGD